MDSQPAIQDRIRTALGIAGAEMAYELGARSFAGGVHTAEAGIPAPLGGGIFIQWMWGPNDALLTLTDGLDCEVRLRRSNPNTPQVDMLMARCASPEYAAAVARDIFMEQNVEAIRHGHAEFANNGLYCPTCLDLGFQAYPSNHAPEEEDG